MTSTLTDRREATSGPDDETAGAHAPHLLRWVGAILVVVVVVSIGLPLIGARVFAATDNLFLHAPWSEFAPPGVVPTNPLVADTVDGVLPRWAEVQQRLGEGDFPLWSTLPLGGIPVGSQLNSALLAPMSLPYYLIPLQHAPVVSKLLELAAAIGFTYLFLRRVGVRRAAAVFGGLVFAYTGFQVAWTNWPQAGVGATIPALLWAVDRLADRPAPHNVALVALATAALVLGGFPAVAGYGLLVAAIWGAIRSAQGTPADDRTGRVARRVGLLAVAGGLGLALSAVQLLPFAEWLDLIDTGYREQTAGSHLPIEALTALVVPDAFGSPHDRIWFGPINYIETAGFVGGTTIVLAIVAFLARRRLGTVPGIQGFAWGLTAAGILLIYVGGAPLRLLQITPGLSQVFAMNHIGRFKSVLGLALAILAALGLHALLRDERPLLRGRWPRALLGAAAAVAGALIVNLYVRWVPDGAGAYAWRQAALPLTVLALAVAAVAWGRRVRWRGAALAAIALPALFAVEALAFTLPYWPRVPPEEFYPDTPAHAAALELEGHGRLAAEHRTMYPGTTTAYGLRSVTAHAFVFPRWAELLEQVDPLAFERGASRPIVRGPTFPHLRAAPDVVHSPVLDRLAVRVFATAPWQSPYGTIVEVVPPTGPGTSLPAGELVGIEIPSLPLRGVVLDLHAPFTGASGPAFLRADVVDGAGAVLTQARRRLWPGDPEPPLLDVGEASVSGPHTGPFLLPVPEVPLDPAGASRPSGGLHVRVWLEASDGAVELTTGPDGRPALALVEAVDDGLRLAHTEGALLWERLTALDRFRWAPRAVVIPEPGARIEALGTGVPADTVVLSAPGPLPDPGAPAPPTRVEVIEPDGDRLRARVDAPQPGYLVVADALQHGWVADVDGRPVDLLEADHALVAVPVPAGQHDVTLTYSPPGWAPGLRITATALVIVAALLTWQVARRRVSPLFAGPDQRRDQVGQQARRQ